VLLRRGSSTLVHPTHQVTLPNLSIHGSHPNGGRSPSSKLGTMEDGSDSRDHGPALHVTVLFPPGHPQEGEVGPVLAFAVLHEAGVLLFDTGVAPGEPEVDEWSRPVHRPLSEGFSTQGLDIGDVTAVANSHLHVDHCGQNRLFTDRPIYVQSTEYEAARQPDYTVVEWVDFPASQPLSAPLIKILPGLRSPPIFLGHAGSWSPSSSFCAR